jgi:L-asparaginase/Glu-tRNA(Gln) amidotransferase subunit D
MSLSFLAISRKNASKELAQLAEDHINHDLQQSDRDALNTAANKFSTYTSVGSLVGLGLGIALGLRVRRIRADYFKAFRAMEKPTHVQFANGRTGMLFLIPYR